jgi:hypothetical protein
MASPQASSGSPVSQHGDEGGDQLDEIGDFDDMTKEVEMLQQDLHLAQETRILLLESRLQNAKLEIKCVETELEDSGVRCIPAVSTFVTGHSDDMKLDERCSGNPGYRACTEHALCNGEVNIFISQLGSEVTYDPTTTTGSGRRSRPSENVGTPAEIEKWKIGDVVVVPVLESFPNGKNTGTFFLAKITAIMVVLPAPEEQGRMSVDASEHSSFAAWKPEKTVKQESVLLFLSSTDLENTNSEEWLTECGVDVELVRECAPGWQFCQPVAIVRACYRTHTPKCRVLLSLFRILIVLFRSVFHRKYTGRKVHGNLPSLALTTRLSTTCLW